MRDLLPGVTEGQTVDSDLALTCDVCIVGSGAGGAVAAARLSAAGLRVIVLEEGGYFTKERFRLREDEAYPNLYQDGGQRTTKDLSVTIMQGKSVGGGTTVNWTTCFRTPDDVVDHWKKTYAVGGITAAQLVPSFEAIEARLSIAEWPLTASNANNRSLYDGCKKLGLDVGPTKRNVKGCVGTGGCGLGCPIDAKQSMHVTYLPDAMRQGATVLSRCRVERVVIEGSRVTQVEGVLLDAAGTTPTGSRVVVKATRVLLCAGAINTPALLLRSGAPDPHGRLGLRTFLHPVILSVAIYDEAIRGFQGPPQSIASHALAHRGEDVGYFLEVGPVHPMLASTVLSGFGKGHHDLMKQLPNVAGHIALTIDGFHDDVPGGRVVLSPSGAPVLDYVVAERTWRALRDAQKTLARIGFASGARRVMTSHDPALVMTNEGDIAKIDALPFAPCRVGVFSAHQMGGAGMSDDVTRGVVRSEDLRHHQLENLHVVDGSVFPTSLGVNPQVSIYGIAHLIAGRLAEEWTVSAR